MMCYRDTTFCSSEVTEHTCGREFTEQDAINAEKWWGGKDYPVAYSEFCKEADNTQPDHIVDMHEMVTEVTDTNQVKRAGIAAYNFERSFVDNVKEISGKGRTAEEARKFWGIDDQPS